MCTHNMRDVLRAFYTGRKSLGDHWAIKKIGPDLSTISQKQRKKPSLLWGGKICRSLKDRWEIIERLMRLMRLLSAPWVLLEHSLSIRWAFVEHSLSIHWAFVERSLSVCWENTSLGDHWEIVMDWVKTLWRLWRLWRSLDNHWEIIERSWQSLGGLWKIIERSAIFSFLDHLSTIATPVLRGFKLQR